MASVGAGNDPPPVQKVHKRTGVPPAPAGPEPAPRCQVLLAGLQDMSPSRAGSR